MVDKGIALIGAIKVEGSVCLHQKQDRQCTYNVTLRSVRAIIVLHTPWSKVLLEKLTGSQLVKNYTGFYETRSSITTFRSAHQLSLSWARSIQSMPPQPNSWRSILMLSSHLRMGLPNGLFPSGCPIKILYAPLLSHACYMTRPSYSSGLI